MVHGFRTVILCLLITFVSILGADAQQTPANVSPNYGQMQQLRQEMQGLHKQVEPLRAQLQQLMFQAKTLREQIRTIEEKMKADSEEMRALHGASGQ